MFDLEKSKILTPLMDPLLEEYGVRVFVKRDDMLHKIAGGNKWRKLKYNLEKAKQENKSTLITFGGAYSNHIAALASSGKELGFKTIGIIRGEKTEPLNVTLSRASDCGMDLIFVDRTTYRNKELALEVALKNYDKTNYYVIPEGGNNYEGFKGCCEVVPEIDVDFNYICCPCGTGTTLAGIIASLKNDQHAIGFSVMKNNFSIEENVHLLLKRCNSSAISNLKFQILHDYHFGGYAKTNPVLNEFIKQFIKYNQIEVEPVYTGKMFFGIYDLVKNGFFKRGDVLVAIHTGGLQYLNINNNFGECN